MIVEESSFLDNDISVGIIVQVSKYTRSAILKFLKFTTPDRIAAIKVRLH